MRKKDRGWLIAAIFCAVICVVGCAILIATVSQPEKYGFLREVSTEITVLTGFFGVVFSLFFRFGNKP